MNLNPKSILLKVSPSPWYLYRYIKASKLMENKSEIRKKFFSKMIEDSYGKDCLQVGVRKKKYAPHWKSVDLYDKSTLIDYNYDIHNLKFKDESFDYIACLAVLEHVENPQQAVKELHRVLRRGGKIWVEIPFNQPYHPSPNDYWRVTPEGMKLLKKDFDCIQSGQFKINNSSIYNGIFFWGQKS